MDADHEELLSPDTFDERIVDIFRALLDTKLVEFRRFVLDKPRPRTDYRNGVKLLRAKLDPLSSFRGVIVESEKDAKLKLLAEAQEKRDAKSDHFDYMRQFLFWFDARAEHWASVEIKDNLPTVAISSERLNALLEQVKGLKQSLDPHTNGVHYKGAAPQKRAEAAGDASQGPAQLAQVAESLVALHPFFDEKGEASLQPREAPRRSQ